MRRLTVVVSAVLLAVLIASSTALAVQAQSAEQYEPSDGSEAPPEPADSKAPSEPSPGANSISQGSVAKASSPAVVAARQDMAEEEKLPDYSQVVDNTTEGRFTAPGWTKRPGGESHGGDFVTAGTGAKSARFEVRIPSTNDYSVYAWWPIAANNSTAVRYVIPTATGARAETVDQSRDGGMWVKLGTYELKSGEGVIQVTSGSAGDGRVVADAVSIVRGELAAPPMPAAPAATPSAEAAGRAAPADARRAGNKKKKRLTGRRVVQQARRHLGDRYGFGTCKRSVKSCTCLTKRAVSPFGHRMSMGERSQWKYKGSRKIPKSRLRPGDEVFFKEGGRRGPITHVGIYAGNGEIVHASSFFGRVVEKKMKYINGYFGAKRFKVR